jgi:hypothetical protein
MSARGRNSKATSDHGLWSDVGHWPISKSKRRLGKRFGMHRTGTFVGLMTIRPGSIGLCPRVAVGIVTASLMSEWHISAIRASDPCALVRWGSSASPMPPILAQWGIQWLACKGVIYMCCLAFGCLSWHPNWSNTLVSLCKQLPLISLPSVSSKLRLEVILVHLH